MNISTTSDLSLTFDLEKSITTFHANPTKNFIQMGVLKSDGVPLIAKFYGTCKSDAVYCSSVFSRSQFSVPMELTDRSSINDLFGKLTKIVQDTVPEWQVNNPLDREDFWLRLNYNEKTKKFKTMSNLNFTNVKSIEKFNELKDKDMTATVELKAWFNLKDEKAGVSLRVIEVNFE